MHLARIFKRETEAGTYLVIEFLQDDGTPGMANFELPADWETWSRPDKVAWVRTELAEWISTIQAVDDVIYPDRSKIVAAKIDYTNLPGWATWTQDEVATWIEENVNTMTDAKSLLIHYGRMFCFIRDIILES